MKKLIRIVLLIGLASALATGCESESPFFDTGPLTITPQEVVPGEEFTVSAEINNAGNAAGVFTAVLKVDGSDMNSDEISLEPGETRTASFSLTEETPGIYQITIDDMAGSVTVVSPEDVINKAADVIRYDKIGSYQKEMLMNLKAVGKVNNLEGDISISLNVTGTVDSINRRLWSEVYMEQETTLLPRNSFAFTMEQYVIGNDRYILLDTGVERFWMRENMPVGSWNELPNIASDTGFLDAPEVKLTGSEKFRGVECYVFEIIPGESWLAEMLLLQTKFQERYQLPLFRKEVIKELFNGIRMKEWVSKDDYYITREEIILSGEVSPEAFQIEGEGKLEVEITFELTLYNQNKPVIIDLPPDAENAISWRDTGDVPEVNLAAENEFRIIQAAVETLMATNGIATLDNPATEPTNDMRHFPDSSGVYVLFEYNKGDSPVDYVLSETTEFFYIVDRFGTVAQLSPGQ